jgi:nucleoside-diphosphate-sugar epimerase
MVHVTLPHIIGASGRSGAALCRSLLADGLDYIPVIRNAERWAATGLPSASRVADLLDGSLAPALHDACLVVSCAHARHIPAILAAAPHAERFVFLGSTRRFTRWPDAHGLGVQAGEAALRASGRPGVILHPTMIYGAAGEDNVQRLAALLRRLPVVPLPGGGRALVQPIHQSDVTRSIRAAMATAWDGPDALVIAGPDALPYAGFVRAVARAAGLRPPQIVPLPAAVLRALAPLTRLPGLPCIGADEIRRLGEDKAFAIADMRRILKIEPIALAAGLALTFRTAPCPSSTASPTSTPR